jgi:CHAT domain
MSAGVPIFRLYLLHRVSSGNNTEFSVLAEYKSYRSAERVKVRSKQVSALAERIRRYWSFVEGGYPVWKDVHLKRFGGELFDLLLPGSIRCVYDRAVGEWGESLLPLELILEDFEFASWPWEYMYDSIRKKFLVQDFYPISRGIFTLTRECMPEQTQERSRILLVSGPDKENKDCSLADEIKDLQNRIETHCSDRFDLTVIPRVTTKQLQEELGCGNPYDILHFHGHGGFDGKEGYLRLGEGEKSSFCCGATQLAQILRTKRLRLVFLNACEAARSAPDLGPAISSVAGRLLEQGIPAIIAPQFSIPATSAHWLAAGTYTALVTGESIINALADGRTAMLNDEMKKFFDWGIPVLYASKPDLVLFPRDPRAPGAAWEASYKQKIRSGKFFNAVSKPSIVGAPSITVESTVAEGAQQRAKVRVALVDIDSNVEFLPEFVVEVNRRQSYYAFQVSYPPFPAVSFRFPPTGTEVERSRRSLYLPSLETYLSSLREILQVEIVFCFTRELVAQQETTGVIWDYFSSRLNTAKMVSAISTFRLRAYAQQAGTSYAKAVMYLCLAMLIVSGKPELTFHKETAGCPLDYCDNRDDILVGLSRLNFDHAQCRARVTNPEELAALDAIVELLLDKTKPFES